MVNNKRKKVSDVVSKVRTFNYLFVIYGRGERDVSALVVNQVVVSIRRHPTDIVEVVRDDEKIFFDPSTHGGCSYSEAVLPGL
jgi:hypothetical protein